MGEQEVTTPNINEGIGEGGLTVDSKTEVLALVFVPAFEIPGHRNCRLEHLPLLSKSWHIVLDCCHRSHKCTCW
jgi:hypothetical protein